MGLFSKDKEESKGSPLFAGLLGGAAVTATPGLERLSGKYLDPSIDNLDREIESRVAIYEDDIIDSLKNSILDRKNRDLPIFLSNESPAFVPASKNYLPNKEEFMNTLKAGGYSLLGTEKKLDPLDAVKTTRRIGGYITAPANTNVATLAHELGHASILNRNQGFRGTKLFDNMDMLGRYLIHDIPASRTAGLFALAGLATDSDNDSKYLIPAVAAATQAPLLYEEAKATKEGLKGIKRLLKNPKTSDRVTKEVFDLSKSVLRKALGTYGAASAGIVAAPLLAIAARSQLDKATRD